MKEWRGTTFQECSAKPLHILHFYEPLCRTRTIFRIVFIGLFHVPHQECGCPVWGESQSPGVLSRLISLENPQSRGMTTVCLKCITLRLTFEAFYPAEYL